MLLVLSEFHFFSSLTVVSKSFAIPVSVSPALTRYVFELVSATTAAGVSAGRDASAVVTRRGISSDWPLLSFEVVRRLLAAARSTFVTWNRRAIVASDSPALVLYRENCANRDGSAEASLPSTTGAMPTGTFRSWAPIGVVVR